MSYYADFIEKNEFKLFPTESAILGKGTIFCKNGIKIIASKELEISKRQNKIYVRTIKYSYHVLKRQGQRTINLFRYDNFDIHPNHPDAHHLHKFSADGNEEIIHIGPNWPTLGDVIKEAKDLSEASSDNK